MQGVFVLLYKVNHYHSSHLLLVLSLQSSDLKDSYCVDKCLAWWNSQSTQSIQDRQLFFPVCMPQCYTLHISKYHQRMLTALTNIINK